MRNVTLAVCWNPESKPRLSIDWASVGSLTAFTAVCAFLESPEVAEVAVREELEPPTASKVLCQRPFIFVSDNPCPEFIEDHWDLGVAAILRTADLTHFEHVLQDLRATTRFRQITPYDRLLTRSECDVLRAEVRGWSGDEIAVILGKSSRVLRDHTATLRDKLRARYPAWNLRKTQHLVHYYYGHWALLNEVAGERTRLPGTIRDQA